MKDLYVVVRNVASNLKIPDIKTGQVYLGENYIHSEEDWAVKLQQADAVFTWVACSFGEIPMWELHAGVVLVGDTAYVGIHCHKDAKPEYIQAVHRSGPAFGEFNDSESAREYQYNKVLTSYDEQDVPELAQTLSNIYIAVRDDLARARLIA